MNEQQFEHDSDVLEADDVGTRRPRKYNVIMHNDDYTTMEFVVLVLNHVFHHDRPKAEVIMQHIHEKGKAVAGTYSFEIAETKAAATMSMARNEGYPLRCTLEKV